MKRLEVFYSPEKVFKSIAMRIKDDFRASSIQIEEGCILVDDNLTENDFDRLMNAFQLYSIQIVEKGQGDLIEQIKNCIKVTVINGEIRKKNLSEVLTDKLGYSYSYLSALFSAETYTSIENFYILTRIERAKRLLSKPFATVAEVAYTLDYSSAAHLSRQFKNITGLTISEYLKFLRNRTANSKPTGI